MADGRRATDGREAGAAGEASRDGRQPVDGGREARARGSTAVRQGQRHPDVQFASGRWRQSDVPIRTDVHFAVVGELGDAGVVRHEAQAARKSHGAFDADEAGDRGSRAIGPDDPVRADRLLTRGLQVAKAGSIDPATGLGERDDRDALAKLGA